VQRAAAEVRPNRQTEAHEKVSKRCTTGVYRMLKVWYNNRVYGERGEYTIEEYYKNSFV
jgi:hypothetical protein